MARRDRGATIKRSSAVDSTLRGVPKVAPSSDDPARTEYADPPTPPAPPSSDDAPAPDSIGATTGSSGVGALGRYQILFPIARGGMGTVSVGRLRAAHGFDRLVAIKTPSLENAKEEHVEAFLGEARLSAKIDHPNVVKTIELGEHDGAPFIAMELVQGVSLARLLKRLKKNDELLDPILAIWIVAQAAVGLHAAHELRDVDGSPSSLVHRDISPENVLLSFDGRVYVADFGVAKDHKAAKQTQSGVVKGKFAYMSPEQTEAVPLDRRSDIFSLGIVLHESLTGQPLFEGRSAADTIRRIWSLEPPDPTTRRNDVPTPVVPVLMRCLAKERGARYRDAEAVAAALRVVLREAGRVADEADLAAAVAHAFPGERDMLRARIREAIALADSDVGTTARSAVAPVGASLSRARREQILQDGPGSVTAGITTGPPLTPRRYAGAWVLVGAAVAIGVGAFALRALDDGPPRREPSADGPLMPAPAPSLASAPPVEPHALPTTTASARALLPESASATGATSRAVAPSPSPRPTSQPAPKPQPPTTSQPPSPRHKGVPFKNL